MQKPKQSLFCDLVARVQACSLCARMQGRRKVLSSLNGDVNARVLFIGEAPGRLGADKFGVPFFGDQAGQNFEHLINSVGLDRASLFITNAVLCNPRTHGGNNDSPTSREVRNCSGFLRETLEIVQPEYIVPLGRVALAALNTIKSHSLKLSESVGRAHRWSQFYVFPLYHPGPRALIWRTRSQQQTDYQVLARLVIEQHRPTRSQ